MPLSLTSATMIWFHEIIAPFLLPGLEVLFWSQTCFVYGFLLLLAGEF